MAPDNTPKRETRKNGVRWSFDGIRWFEYEYDVFTYPDWRDTPLGPVNFGHVRWGPTRLVETRRYEEI